MKNPAQTASTTSIMQDFVFGGIEADDSRLLASERHHARSIRHGHRLDPLDPAPGQPVTLTVHVGPDVHIDRLTAYATTDGSSPAGSRGQATSGIAVEFERVETLWNPLLWHYIAVWQATLEGQPEGTLVQYRIEGWREGDEDFAAWSREPNLDRTVEQPTRYGYHVDKFAVPQWARDAVVYHIFVDRFAVTRDAGVDEPHDRWLTPEEMSGFVGGTLRGVIDRLDYIADLGATVVWLSPIFATETNHGYDTTDYYAIDPRFGTADDLRELVQQAHARGLRVLLDFVANHASHHFPPFVDARENPDSQYRDWWSFSDSYTHGYRTFFDVAMMPQFNVDNAGARQFLCEAAQHWLHEFGIDGYRLDYAAGPGHVFWSEFRAACRAANPECWLFGEVTRAGEMLRTYAGRLDGCLDFAFARTLRQLCAAESPLISMSEFANVVERSQKFFGTRMNAEERGSESEIRLAPHSSASHSLHFVQPSFLDNHDINRFLWMAAGESDEEKVQRLQLAATLMFALGGPPILYYGTEVGLSQSRPKAPYREESRQSMWWGERQDRALRAWFQRLIHTRRDHPALRCGDLRTLHLDDARHLWLAQRTHETDCVLVAINAGDESQSIMLPKGEFADCLTGKTAKEGLMLSPRSAVLLMRS